MFHHIDLFSSTIIYVAIANPEVCEHVLAHKLLDEVEATYLRGAYLEKRKVLMGDWAKFSNL